jgi:hypothetical protein
VAGHARARESHRERCDDRLGAARIADREHLEYGGRCTGRHRRNSHEAAMQRCRCNGQATSIDSNERRSCKCILFNELVFPLPWSDSGATTARRSDGLRGTFLTDVTRIIGSTLGLGLHGLAFLAAVAACSETLNTATYSVVP